MKKFLRCEVDGECFNRFLEGGHAVDPEQVIELSRVEEWYGDKDMVAAYPTKDTDVQLIGKHGDVHVEHIYANGGIIVPKKFIQDAPVKDLGLDR